VWAFTLPQIEVYGTRGAIIVPDLNCFDGQILVKLTSTCERPEKMSLN